jgi:hypothetical protein
MAEAVIASPLVRVAEDRIGFADFFEFLFCILRFVTIRVILKS